MDNLSPEHLHILLDEPIYVLADHGDHPIEEAIVEEDQPLYRGENNQGICLFVGDSNQEDIDFLFKGLNALNLQEKDVAIFDSEFISSNEYPSHSKRLIFTTRAKIDTAFNVILEDSLKRIETIPLNEIRNNQEFKRNFWEALKTIFKEE